LFSEDKNLPLTDFLKSETVFSIRWHQFYCRALLFFSSFQYSEIIRWHWKNVWEVVGSCSPGLADRQAIPALFISHLGYAI